MTTEYIPLTTQDQTMTPDIRSVTTILVISPEEAEPEDAKLRSDFEELLKSRGVRLSELELEEGVKVVAVAAGWDIVCRVAEEVRLSMPTVSDTYEVSQATC